MCCIVCRLHLGRFHLNGHREAIDSKVQKDSSERWYGDPVLCERERE